MTPYQHDPFRYTGGRRFSGRGWALAGLVAVLLFGTPLGSLLAMAYVLLSGH